jgi:hypothetical protein
LKKLYGCISIEPLSNKQNYKKTENYKCVLLILNRVFVLVGSAGSDVGRLSVGHGRFLTVGKRNYFDI